MQLQELINNLIQYLNSLLNREGLCFIIEIKEIKRKRVFLRVKDRFISLEKNGKKFNSTEYDLNAFIEIFDTQESIKENIKEEILNSNDESYILSHYKHKVLKDLNDLLYINREIRILHKFAQNTNYSYLKSIDIYNFFTIENINFNEIGSSKEIYLLGENGDGKTLVLMALHLAHNGRYIGKYTNLEYTGKIEEIIRANATSRLLAEDFDGTSYGLDKMLYLKNFYCYGVHRGRYSSDKFEKYGMMTLYDSKLELYSPEKLLIQNYLFELEKKLDAQNSIGENKDLPNWIPLKDIQYLFMDLLEKNVEIEVSSNGVTFKEKGAMQTFNQLSEGYKNIMIWVSDLIYRCQTNQPEVNKIANFKGIVIIDEIELHLHPIWQRKIVSKLRKHFSNFQFIFSTHSPSIIQGASEDAVIYKIYRNPKTGKTSASNAYFKRDLDHLMLNSLATSPLFGLNDARISSKVNKLDTNDTYLQSRIAKKIEEELKKQKENGKVFISDNEIDKLINDILKEELK